MNTVVDDAHDALNISHRSENSPYWWCDATLGVQSDELKKMISRPLKTVIVVLLGFVLAHHGAFSTSTAGGAPGAKAGCCCLGCDFKSCATPACCAKPAGNRAPVSPAPLPSSSQNEWQATAAVLVSLLTLPPPAAHRFAFASHSLAPVGAVPIFQRDCAYLL